MNKIQKFGLVLAAVVLTAGTSQVYALTESWNAATSRFLTDPSGTTGVPAGGLIEIGLVSNPAGAAAATSPAQLASFMTVFAQSTIGTGEGGIAGAFAVVSGSPGAGFFSQQIYLLAFNAPTAGAATQMGLFTNPAWLFAASDAAAANSLDIGDAGTTAIQGSFSAGTVTSPSDIAGTDAARLVLVPEPSSVMLVLTGLLGLLGLRRRS